MNVVTRFVSRFRRRQGGTLSPMSQTPDPFWDAKDRRERIFWWLLGAFAFAIAVMLSWN